MRTIQIWQCQRQQMAEYLPSPPGTDGIWPRVAPSCWIYRSWLRTRGTLPLARRRWVPAKRSAALHWVRWARLLPDPQFQHLKSLAAQQTRKSMSLNGNHGLATPYFFFRLWHLTLTECVIIKRAQQTINESIRLPIATPFRTMCSALFDSVVASKQTKRTRARQSHAEKERKTDNRIGGVHKCMTVNTHTHCMWCGCCLIRYLACFVGSSAALYVLQPRLRFCWVFLSSENYAWHKTNS